MEETAHAHRAEGFDVKHVEVVLPLGTDSGAAARGRRLVAQELRRHGLAEIADDAELVAGELMTNALLHAGPPIELVLRLAPPRARVEVRDSSRVPPVRPRPSADGMTGRGVHLVDALTRSWGVTPLESGKAVWADLEVGTRVEAPDHDEAELLAMWAADEPDLPPQAKRSPRPRSAAKPEQVPAAGEPRYTIQLGDVPTELLLSAKAHVDNLMREFTLATSGARSGATAPVPAPIADLIHVVRTHFAEARDAIKRQAVAAAHADQSHVSLTLTLPASAADAGEEYLRALDDADTYCRAARLLTLETPPQHRVFRQWYVQELIAQLRRAAAGEPSVRAQPFDQRLLQEIDRVAAAERQSGRAARLQTLTVALAAAATPEAVASAVLREGVAALGASGGGMLLATEKSTLTIRGAVGYDEHTLSQLRSEALDAQLPAAVAMRTGKSVWLESRAERDTRYKGLAGMEPSTISMCAVPLIVDQRRLGALRFSFTEARLFDAEERTFVEAIAAQTSQALDRAQLHERRFDVTRRLQRSLLPARLPDIPGVEVHAAYQAGTAAMEVGGDFYDVWPCGDHCWAVAIGDVCGTGPEAAAITALVRHTLRALTMTSMDIETILRQLDQALAETALESPNERFSTVMFGILDVNADGYWLDFATGGHLGPVIVRADGTVEIVEMAGSMLGVLPDATIDRRRIALAPGDEVVLITDGATEARNADGFFGMEGVATAAAAAHASNANTAEAINRAAHAHAGHLDDDLAVLALRRRAS